MEFFNKIGNAFANLGSGNSLYGDQQQMNMLRNSANPEDVQKLQQFKKQGLQNFADAMGVIAAQGDPQRIALAQNTIRQRQLDEAEAKAKAEKKAQQELLKQQQDAFIEANPEYAKMIQMKQLFNITEGSNKLTKSDFVVEILEKIKNNPGYKLTDTDQRILDTISDTDPMKILIRNRLNEMQVNNFSNQNTNQSGPVTVTTQEEFDSLPKGTKYIYNGTEYVKGQ
jgi:hypothetical protein